LRQYRRKLASGLHLDAGGIFDGLMASQLAEPKTMRRSFERVAMQMKRKVISQKDERPADLRERLSPSPAVASL
jgi:hypothetical protein